MKGEITAVRQDDRFVRFQNLIYNASKSLLRIKTVGMEEYGLASTHTFCLRSLYGRDTGMTRTELAQECAVDKAQISRLICELSDMGYVLEASKGKGYRKKIVLTEEGRRIAESIDQKVNLVLSYIDEEISEERIEDMYQTLAKICDCLKRAEEDGLSVPPSDNESLIPSPNHA